MADGLFAVEVVAPEEKLLEARARAIVLRSSDGDLTVLDGHTPLVTDVVDGQVRVDVEEGDPKRFAVHGGFLQVSDAKEGETLVTVLAGVAEPAEAIDVTRAERARAAAAERVEQLEAVARSANAPSGQPTTSLDAQETGAAPEEVELAEARAALRRAEVRLEVAGIATG